MKSGRSFQEVLERGRRREPARWDSSALDVRFVRYFESGERIKVQTAGMEITGTVGITTGWRPAFLLMRRSNSIGSPWVLGPSDWIVAVKRGRKYVAVQS